MKFWYNLKPIQYLILNVIQKLKIGLKNNGRVYLRNFLLACLIQQQITSLASKVTELGEVNITLRRYMETLISKVSPTDSEDIIEIETKRLQNIQMEIVLKNNRFVKFLIEDTHFLFDDIKSILMEAKTINNFISRLTKISGKYADTVVHILRISSEAREDLNVAREVLGLKRFSFRNFSIEAD
jgi:hypothetical protein